MAKGGVAPPGVPARGRLGAVPLDVGPPMSRAEARAHIAALQLPPLVLAIFDGGAAPAVLRFKVKAPENALCPISELPIGFVPIYESGTVVVGHLSAENVFAELSLETPDEPFWRRRTFRSVVAQILVELWEAEAEDDDIHAVAAELDFPAVAALLDRLRPGGYDPAAIAAAFDT